MTETGYVILALCCALGGSLVALCKCAFKIAYYETRLELRGIDIEDVKNMTLWQMLRS